MRNNIINYSKMGISIIMMFLLIMELIRPWTNFPRSHTNATGKLAEHSISNYLGKFSIFGYFTVLSNIIMVIIINWKWIIKKEIKSLFVAMGVTYMFTTSVIFWATIAPYMKWNDSPYDSFNLTYMHCFPFIIGLLVAREVKLDFKLNKSFFQLMIFPIIFLLYSIILYLSTNGDAIVYPFLAFEDFLFLGMSRGISITIATLFLFVVAGIFYLEFWVIYKYILRK